MGQAYGEWEQVTRSLLEEAEGERARLTQRLTNLQEALTEVDQRVTAIQATLNAYWTKYGKPQRTDDNYSELTAKGMVLRWADEHGGRVVMADLAKALVAMGIFSNPQTAAGAVYPAIRRLPGFTKVSRGVYVRKNDTVDIALAVKHNGQYEQTEQAESNQSNRLFGRGQFDPQYGPHDRNSQEHGIEAIG